MKTWAVGDVVDVPGSGLWVIYMTGARLYLLVNDAGRAHTLTIDDLDTYDKVEL